MERGDRLNRRDSGGETGWETEGRNRREDIRRDRGRETQ
jgi:hypothetical protein